jgi:hypothetical protein
MVFRSNMDTFNILQNQNLHAPCKCLSFLCRYLFIHLLFPQYFFLQKSWIHFSFLFISAARFFLVYHRKIPYIFLHHLPWSAPFLPFFQPIHSPFSLPTLRGLLLPVHAFPPFLLPTPSSNLFPQLSLCPMLSLSP